MSALAVKYLTGCIYQEVILGIQLRCLKVAILVLGTEDINLSQVCLLYTSDAADD